MAEQKTITVLVPIATGYEDIETVSIIDILTRAGAKITIVSCDGAANGNIIKGCNGTKMVVDGFIEDVQNNVYDMITIPGGMKNAESLAKNEILIKMYKIQKQSGRWYSAICASPALVFEPNGILDGEKGTSYPGLSDKLKDQSMVNNNVVISNKCVTSRGPGTAGEFGFALVKVLFGAEKSEQLKKQMLYVF